MAHEIQPMGFLTLDEKFLALIFGLCSYMSCNHSKILIERRYSLKKGCLLHICPLTISIINILTSNVRCHRLLACSLVASGERESHISINASTATLSLSSDFLQKWSLPEHILWLTTASCTIARASINFFCESTFALQLYFFTQSLHGSFGCFQILTFTTHLLLLFLLIFL